MYKQGSSEQDTMSDADRQEMAELVDTAREMGATVSMTEHGDVVDVNLGPLPDTTDLFAPDSALTRFQAAVTAGSTDEPSGSIGAAAKESLAGLVETAREMGAIVSVTEEGNVNVSVDADDFAGAATLFAPNSAISRFQQEMPPTPPEPTVLADGSAYKHDLLFAYKLLGGNTAAWITSKTGKVIYPHADDDSFDGEFLP